MNFCLRLSNCVSGWKCVLQYSCVSYYLDIF